MITNIDNMGGRIGKPLIPVPEALPLEQGFEGHRVRAHNHDLSLLIFCNISGDAQTDNPAHVSIVKENIDLDGDSFILLILYG